MRRLDLHPQKKLRNPARHVRSLEKWSRSFAGFFPTEEMAYERLWYEKIPIFEKVVSPPHTNNQLQKRCAQLVIDAAERLRDARPSVRKDVRVYAFLSFPNMFSSFIEVDFGSKPYLFFDMPEMTDREGDDKCWHEYFRIDRGLFHDLSLRIPKGFEVRGTGLRVFDTDWMPEPVETEEWAVGELRPA